MRRPESCNFQATSLKVEKQQMGAEKAELDEKMSALQEETSALHKSLSVKKDECKDLKARNINLKDVD